MIVFLHGGMWMLNDLDTHDRTCRRLAASTGARWHEDARKLLSAPSPE